MLTAREHALLEFEETFVPPRNNDPRRGKEARVREEFGCSLVRYYQLLGTLTGRPDALAAFPMLAHRMDRQRDLRSRRRSERLEIRAR